MSGTLYFDSSESVDPSSRFKTVPLLEWTNEDVALWVRNIEDEELDVVEIGDLFQYHNITGPALQYLSTNLLADVGITSLRSRLKLKTHLDQLLLQNSLIDKDLDYSSTLLGSHSQTQLQSDYKKLNDQFHKLREDLLPVMKWVKDQKPLPTPELSKFSSPFYNSQPSSSSSPTKSSAKTSQTASPILETHLTSPPVPQFPLNSSLSSSNLRSLNSSKRKSIISPTERTNFTTTSPTLPLGLSNSASTTLLPTRPQLQQTPSQQSVTRPQLTASGSEPLKQLRAKTDDPCYKILQHAMRRHGISNDDWRKYALVICYGDQERVLELNEKPVVIFRELQEQGQRPAIMLRQIDYNDDDETITATPGGRI